MMPVISPESMFVSDEEIQKNWKLHENEWIGVPHCGNPKWCGWKIFRFGCFNFGKCRFKCGETAKKAK